MTQRLTLLLHRLYVFLSYKLKSFSAWHYCGETRRATCENELANTQVVLFTTILSLPDRATCFHLKETIELVMSSEPWGSSLSLTVCVVMTGVDYESEIPLNPCGTFTCNIF